MPEGSEIHIFAHLINSQSEGKTFIKVSQANWPSNPTVSIPWSAFRISAVARGKELRLTCSPAVEVPGAVPIVLIFNHGLVGKWEWLTASSLATAPAAAKLMFHTATHSLVYLDSMKIGRWRLSSEWGTGRSPDAILDFFNFCNHVLRTVHKKMPTQPICNTLLEQSLFNGVGNYLRAEMLNRAGLDPFQSTELVFANSPKSVTLNSFSSIIAEATAPRDKVAELVKTTKHDPGLMLLFLARQIQLEVLQGGMNKYGTELEQAKFNQWLRVYGKGKEVKMNGRSVHCTPEQRLGTQARYLGSLVDTYPYPNVDPVVYPQPTITAFSSATPSDFTSSQTLATSSTPGIAQTAIQTQTFGFGTQPPSPSPHATLSPSSSSASWTNAASAAAIGVGAKMEEKLIPLEEICDLKVPMMSKLLMAVTSLNRQSKLTWGEDGSFRELIFDNHPIAYSAWQVFEANSDEEDFIDTMRRLARATEPIRAARKHSIQSAPSSTFGSMPQSSHFSMRAQPATFNMAAPHNPFGLGNSAARDSSSIASSSSDIEISASILAGLSETGATKRPSSAITKRTSISARSLSSSSSASSVTGSDGGDVSSDEDEEMLRPKKKAMLKTTTVKKAKTPAFGQTNLKSGMRTKLTSGNSPTSKPKFGEVVEMPSLAKKSGGLDFVSLLGDKAWLKHVSNLLTKDKQLQMLSTFLANAYAQNSPPVYPAVNDIFNAFKCCSLDDVKVVILGQDPYHGPGQAHGLCFSVLPPNAPPPSLLNIYKELEKDIPGFTIPKHGDLTAWAKQGVFLLNTVLTVFQSQPNSHAQKGWERFTDHVIRTISEERKGVIFMLWGKPSMKLSKFINKDNEHTILTAAHPSPLSAFNGWFGCKHFSTANTILKASGVTPIDWRL